MRESLAGFLKIKEDTMFRKLLLGITILCFPALASAGEWVQIDPPTYLHKNCNTCINTLSKGGVQIYYLDIPCVLKKTTYGALNGSDLLLHNIAPPYCHCRCNHWSHGTYRIYQRPRWSRYSIFSLRRLCR